MAAGSAKKAGSANPTVLAMDHPITLMMLVLGMISLGILSYARASGTALHTIDTEVERTFQGGLQSHPGCAGAVRGR